MGSFHEQGSVPQESNQWKLAVRPILRLTAKPWRRISAHLGEPFLRAFISFKLHFLNKVRIPDRFAWGSFENPISLQGSNRFALHASLPNEVLQCLSFGQW